MKKHFRLLVQHIIDGIVIVGTDGLIRFTNPAAEQLFQQTSEQLIGTPFGFAVTEHRTTEIDIVGEHGRSTPVELGFLQVERI